MNCCWENSIGLMKSFIESPGATVRAAAAFTAGTAVTPGGGVEVGAPAGVVAGVSTAVSEGATAQAAATAETVAGRQSGSAPEVSGVKA